MLALGSAHAQRISVSGLERSGDGNKFELCATIEAQDLAVSTEAGYRLVFSIDDGRQRLLLPEIEYMGGLRSRYEHRREVLSNLSATTPYKIFRKVKRDRTYTTDYNISMPYEAWMTEAAIYYNLYRYVGSGLRLVASGIMPALDRSKPVYSDSQLRLAMTDYVVPEHYAKRRTAVFKLDTTFPLVKSAELDGLMSSASARHPIKIERIHITAYGSPDGKFNDNDRFAQSRAEATERYITTTYPHTGAEIRVSWVAEDWDGLTKAVEADTLMPNRNKVLSTIVASLDREPDAREWLVKTIDDRRSYNYLLENIYPALRRTELEASYLLPDFNDQQAAQLLPTNPEQLSPQELYRVAMLSPEGSDERRHSRKRHPQRNHVFLP